MTFLKDAQGGALSTLSSTPDVFDGALDSFRRWQDAKVAAKKTMQAYLLGTRRFHAFLVAHQLPTRLEKITQRHVELWIISMRGEPTRTGAALCARSINRYANSLRVFFNWCVAEELLERSPMARIHPARADTRPPDMLTLDEVGRLFKTCEGKGFHERRDLALMRVWFATGIRRAEIAGLQLADVNLDQRTLYVRGKGRRERYVRIGRKAMVALDRYLYTRKAHRLAPTSDALWLGHHGPLGYQGVYEVLRRRAEQAKIARLHPHMWRHLLAHRYLDNDGGETNLKALMGWSSNAMLGVYGASKIASRARDEYDRLGLDDEV